MNRWYRYGLAACFIIIGIVSVFTIIAHAQALRHIHPQAITPPPMPTHQTVQTVKKDNFYKWSPNDVLDAFKSRGLEVVDIAQGFTVGAPEAVENRIFLIPTYGKDVGSMVSSFDSVEHINESAKYYSKMNTDPELPVWWLFKKGNVLVLISGRVPGDKAREYGQAVAGMKKN